MSEFVGLYGAESEPSRTLWTAVNDDVSVLVHQLCKCSTLSGTGPRGRPWDSVDLKLLQSKLQPSKVGLEERLSQRSDEAENGHVLSSAVFPAAWRHEGAARSWGRVPAPMGQRGHPSSPACSDSRLALVSWALVPAGVLGVSGRPLRPVGGESRTSVRACHRFCGRRVLKWVVGLASDNKGGP